MAAAALLLDLDGTVRDSRPWYAATIAQLSGVAVSEIVTKLTAGANVVRLAREYGVSRTRLTQAASSNSNPLELYLGVRHALDRIRERGTPVEVVSNLPGWLVMPLLESTVIDRYFSATITPRAGVPAKPQPHGIRKALRTMGREPDPETWFVGDAVADAGAARAATVRFSWASYGYEPKSPPWTATVLKRFEDVLQL